jgi:hypothetical protein
MDDRGLGRLILWIVGIVLFIAILGLGNLEEMKAINHEA